VGMRYEPDGMLWDVPNLFDASSQIYVDYVHNILASGGVGQLEVNAFCLSLRGVGIMLKDLDEFAGQCFIGTGSKGLPANFFSDRVPMKAGLADVGRTLKRFIPHPPTHPPP